MIILSIDCGIKNLALCRLEIIEKDINTKYNTELQNIIKNNNYKFTDININNKINKIKKLLEKKINILNWENINILDNKTSKVKNVLIFDLTKALIQHLDARPYLLDCDYVLIEQQPSKNNKMKIIQTSLYSYFMIRGVIDSNIKKIDFVSPKHKLRGTTSSECALISSLFDDQKNQTRGARYRNNKQVGIKFCESLLDDNWKEFYNSKKGKKDDYSDAFLQAYCYYNLILAKYKN